MPEDMVVERVYLEKSKVRGAEGEKHGAKKVSDLQENGEGCNKRWGPDVVEGSKKWVLEKWGGGNFFQCACFTSTDPL